MEVLLSEKNPLLKQVRRAVQKGSLTDDGFAVAEGFHLLEEALKSQAEIGTVIVSQSVKGAIQSHVKGLKLRVVTVRDAEDTGGRPYQPLAPRENRTGRDQTSARCGQHDLCLFPRHSS